MTRPELPPDALPLVICGPDGRPMDIAWQNGKGHRKSIEHGTLWAVHPETGRLLPYGSAAAASVETRDGWYVAVVSAPAGEPWGGRAPGAPAAPPAADPGDIGAAAGAADEPVRPTLGPVLESLAGLVHRRRLELPEGSYTTHLFTAGSEKIRKKTGEEAIEVVLARTREALTGEVADLLYHLLVLLESEGIGLGEVAEELRRR